MPNEVEVDGELSDHADILRKMWQHEDTIANHRITWFTTTQGLLFAALAIVFREQAHRLSPILVCVGLGSCVLTSISLFLGVKAKNNLQIWWRDNGCKYTGPPVVGYYFEAGANKGHFSPSNLLPLLFLTAWLFAYFRLPSGA